MLASKILTPRAKARAFGDAFDTMLASQIRCSDAATKWRTECITSIQDQTEKHTASFEQSTTTVYDSSAVPQTLSAKCYMQ